MPTESAVIIPVPEVEPIVGPLRLQYDRAVHLGVPAHITLLYPFCPAPGADDEVKTLRNICLSIAAFPFSFTDVRRFPSTAYLHPNQSEAFVEITKNLVKMWPECKPYGGAFPEIIPHLTVANDVDVETLNAVEDCLRRQLPIPCVAREIWLLQSDHAGMWSKRAFFPLAASMAP